MTRLVVRRVPADFVHPKNDRGFQPLFDGLKFDREWKDWWIGYAEWIKGLCFDEDTSMWIPIPERNCDIFWEDWHGPEPDPVHYTATRDRASATHLMFYLQVTEGTPDSDQPYPTLEAAILAYRDQDPATSSEMILERWYQTYSLQLLQDDYYRLYGMYGIPYAISGILKPIPEGFKRIEL